MVAWSQTHSTNLADKQKFENSKHCLGFHGPGWLRVVGHGSRDYLPLLTTLIPQSTCQGPRPGPKLACGVRAGSPLATEPRARPAAGTFKKKCRRAKKTHTYIYITHKYEAPLRAVGCSPRGNARRDATGENSQPPSSGAPRSMRAIPNERNN